MGMELFGINFDLEFASYILEEAELTVIVSAPQETLGQIGFSEDCEKLLSMDFNSRKSIEHHLAYLGLDFYCIIVNALKSQIFFASGGYSSRPLFYKIEAGKIAVRDNLPRFIDLRTLFDNLCLDWIVGYLSTTISTGPFENRSDTKCIHSGWDKISGGNCLILDSSHTEGRFSSFDNIFQGLGSSTLNNDFNALSESIDERLLSLSTIGKMCTEFSGGIDSGIVFSRAKKMLGDRFIGGLTSEYPFFEFRREVFFRDEILNFAGGTTQALDATQMLPFSRLLDVPYHDEPTVNSTSWGQIAHAVSKASEIGARVLCHGHGGDVIFLHSPQTNSAATNAHTFPTWIPKKLAATIRLRSEFDITSLSLRMPSGIGSMWHPSMLEPGFFSTVGTAKSPHMRYTSGLISRNTLRSAAVLWNQHDPKSLERHIQKPIGKLAFPNSLPNIVWARPGKVNHLANVYRGAILNADDIRFLVSSYGEVLSLIGIDPNAYSLAANNAVEGINSGCHFFSKALGLLVWVHSHISSNTDSADREFTQAYENPNRWCIRFSTNEQLRVD